MIQNIVNQFIDTIPDSVTKELTLNPININIVLEGGAFNGSYLAGCLFYLKEFEKRSYIKIHKLSACSVGTLISLAYFIDDLEVMSKIYDIAYKQFKQNADINIFEKAFIIIRKHITNNIFSKINNRLYITYFNVKNGKQKVICKYKNVEHLLDIIRRSCSFPYIIDKNLYYKNKYVDGMYPYIFSSMHDNYRILYLNLHSINHINGLIYVKNEKSNLKRIFEGIVNIHTFFAYNTKTDICSFVDEWSLIEHFKHYLFITTLTVFTYILHKVYIIHNIVHKSFNCNNISVLDLINFSYNCIIKQYCV
jgi:hypothetical protein